MSSNLTPNNEGLQKYETEKTLVAAYYDCGEWQEIPLLPRGYDIYESAKRYSMRRNYLCGVFETPYQIGFMIFDNPLTLFLHGIRYNREDYKLVDLETIVENAKTGI